MDRIHIRDLRLRAIIGIYPDERRKPQDVIINLELRTDLHRAGETDQLADTVDYKALKGRIIAHVEQSRHLLLEKMAAEVARICLDTPGVNSVRVTVDKPGALRFARSVAIDIERP
jgi:dihydroneopterin aldolase/D-erythro-7,8-dihydroneopterin triphosphate epimerase